MRKKLFAIGNSFALLIDKGTRRRLGVTEESLLHLYFDEHRLVVERSVDDPASPESVARAKRETEIRAIKSLLRDLDRLGLTKNELEKLSFDGMSFGEILGAASRGQSLHPITVLRFRRCLERRRAHKESLEATIDLVIASIPNPNPVRRRRGSRATKRSCHRATRPVLPGHRSCRARFQRQQRG